MITAYANDATSLRRGFFLQKLCLQNIPNDKRKISPDQVIQEFNRAPDRNNKCQLAVARFKAECCLRGLLLTPDGKQKPEQVTPDAVVKDFPDSPEGKLGIARFKAECCLRGLLLTPDGKQKPGQVTPDAVVKDFQAAKATLELARFKEQCCLRGLLLTPDGKQKPEQVTPDAVVKDFPDSPEGKLGIARFKAECCLRGLLLTPDGKQKPGQVTPDAVVKDYQAAKATLELARFKAECCLRGLPLNGQQVTPDAVVKDYQAAKATLELARFKEQCCLRGLLLTPDGKQKPGQVTPDAVVKDYQAAKATLELARFKAECCLRGLLLTPDGKQKPGQVTPDAVVKDFQAAKATLELARFKEQCCLRGLLLTPDGKQKPGQVTPDAVVKDYQAAKATLELARFKAECCLRGLPLNGQQVTPDAVVKDYQAAKATLELARFKAECCLRGLLLTPDGKQKPGQVTPDAVVKDFQAAKATLELARFKEQCCLRGLLLTPDGKQKPGQVTPDAVVKDYQAAKATLELARFKAECCLRGLLLTPDGKQKPEQVTPDAVVKDYQAAKATLELARFKEQCCLRGLLLTPDGKQKPGQVTPDAVVKDYECSGWPLERAIFYSQLALNARELNGCQLDNEAVLKAFNEVPGDHSSRQTEYLIQRLKKPQLYDETNETQDTLQQAWQILNNVSLKDDAQHRLQCILKFMAMQYELSIDHQRVSAEQVLQTIKTLRSSFQNSRLEFFFLAHCFKTGLSIEGQKIHERQVLNCLQNFPEGSKLRHALSCWFEQFSSADYLMEELLFKRDNSIPKRDSDRRHGHAASASQYHASVTVSRKHSVSPELCSDKTNAGFLPSDEKNSHSAHSTKRVNSTIPDHRDLPDVIPDTESSGRRTKSVEVSIANLDKGGPLPCQVLEYWGETKKTENTFVTQTVNASAAQTLKQWLNVGGASLPDNQVARLNALTLEALEIIQEINSSYTHPPILITGSFSRFLQNRCSSFKDIDIICMTEESARTLFEKLQKLNAEKGSEIPQSIIIWPIPGCPEIKLPTAYNINLNEGDLGSKAMGIQVSIEARVTHENAEPLPVHVPGVERQVSCLSFADETKLLNNTLEYLADHLAPLTEQLQKGGVFDVPRTILFNLPKTTDERIYGLLMRSLLTLNKARQFISLYSEDKPDQLPEQQRLHALTKHLQMELCNHNHRDGFVQSVNHWLSTAPCVNDYEIKKKDFIKGLLAIMHPE